MTSIPISLFILIFAIMLMAKAAVMEEMSPVLWGGITLIACLACFLTLPFGLIINGIIGFLISLTAMFIVKEIRKERS